MYSDFHPSCALLWRAESDGRLIAPRSGDSDYARPAATARRMCRGSTPPQNPSFRGLVRSLLCAMLLPQWMRGAVSSMADSMLALFALSLGAPASAVGAIVGAQFIGVTCSVLFVAVAVERAGQRASIIAGLVINAAAGVASAATPTWSLLLWRFAI